MMKEKCSVCNKKLKVVETLMKCSLCNQSLCTKHRYYDTHACVDKRSLSPVELVKIVSDKIDNRI